MPPKLKFAEGLLFISIQRQLASIIYISTPASALRDSDTGEKVLCFHGPLIYEAKALRSQVSKDKQVKYFIHYAGWNKK